MKKLLIVGMFGLLPLWIALVWLVVGAVRHEGSLETYWPVAPWLIAGGIMGSPVTTVGALAASHLFQNADGGPVRKWILAALAYVGSVALIWMILSALKL